MAVGHPADQAHIYCLNIMERDMGSRKQGNYGGSGKEGTRQDCFIHARERDKPKPQLNVQFTTVPDLDFYLSMEKIFCLECGLEFRSLGHHLARAHSMSSLDYKKKYNIPKTRSLACSDYRKVKGALSKSNWKSGIMEHVRERIKEEGKNFGKVGNSAERISTIYHKNYKKTCLYCNKDFVRKGKKYRYCSLECYHSSAECSSIGKENGALGGRKEAKRNALGRFEAQSNQITPTQQPAQE